MKNLLSNSIVYLCGAIDRCPNAGAVWRDMISPQLACMGVKVLNPLKKACSVGLESDDHRSVRQTWKEDGQYDRFASVMKTIGHVDLTMMYRSHFILAYLDLRVFACGTIDEIIKGAEAGKPVLIVCEQGKIHIPDWLWIYISHTCMFNNFDEALDYLDGINIGRIEAPSPWVFLNNG